MYSSDYKTYNLPMYLGIYPQKLVQCSNGLSILFIQGIYDFSVRYKWLFYVGSVQDPSQQTGMAHFIEHMFFKGTEKHRTTRNLVQQVNEYGAYINAFTMEEFTGYEVQIDNKKWKTGLNILREMLYESVFPEHEMKKEKKVVLQELLRNLSNPVRVAYEYANENMWSGTPYGTSTQQDIDNIKNITRESMLEHLQKYYTTQRSLFIIVGKLPSLKSAIPYVVRTMNRPWCDTVLSNMKFPYPSKICALKPYPNVRAPIWWGKKRTYPLCFYKHFASTTQVYIHINYPAVDYDDVVGKACFCWIQAYLTEGMGSRLYVKLREETGYVYSISSYLNEYYAGSVYTIYTITNVKTFLPVLKIIYDEIRKLLDPISDNIFNFYKSMCYGADKIGMEQKDNLDIKIAMSYFYMGLKPSSILQPKIPFHKITKKLIKKYVKKYLLPSCSVITYLAKSNININDTWFRQNKIC